MPERLRPAPVFFDLSPAEAADPALYAELLDLWVAVIDAGGAVGFTAPADRDAVARTLRGQLGGCARAAICSACCATTGEPSAWRSSSRAARRCDATGEPCCG